MLQVIGRLHPALVHFPIALLLAALAAELLRPRPEGPSAAGFFCLALGTLGALAAVLSGWLFAAHDPPGVPELLERHRWAGLGAAVAACATLVSAWRWRRSEAPELARPTRIGLVLTALLVGFSGHLGGTMEYGEGFVLQPLRVPAAKLSRAVETSAVGDMASASGGKAGNPAATPLDFLTDVRPVLERRCFECHGERKRPKAGRKLGERAPAVARDQREAVIVPGDPDAILVYQRISLPPDDDDLMPPEHPLPSTEIALIRRWIAEGAHWSSPAAETNGKGG